MRPIGVLVVSVLVSQWTACGGGATKTPEQAPRPQCSDGLDNDGDGKIDWPIDPGCTSASDDSEADDCPSGPNCPVCSNGVDDDGDGTTDYPADTSCRSASGPSEACPSGEPVPVVNQQATLGDTTFAANDYEPPCGAGSSGPDLVYQLEIPDLSDLHIKLDATWDAAMVLLGSTCSGAAIACSNPEDFHVASLAGGTYFLVVDGLSHAAFGPFTLNVSGLVAPGGSCESALFLSGALACDTGLHCDGALGARTCRVPQCSDGIDNDGDGKIDWPDDPGCSSPFDDAETDDCPGGPNCPACSDGLDNDGDGKIDYPSDPSCASASGASEA
jgi:large repetitive protein